MLSCPGGCGSGGRLFINQAAPDLPPTWVDYPLVDMSGEKEGYSTCESLMGPLAGELCGRITLITTIPELRKRLMADPHDLISLGSSLLNSADVGDGLTSPGPFAGPSIPARGPERDFTDQERQLIDEIMSDFGCHRCGTTDPGTKSGHAVPDHRPPNAMAKPGEPRRLYPHCLQCSREQGLAIARLRWQ